MAPITSDIIWSPLPVKNMSIYQRRMPRRSILFNPKGNRALMTFGIITCWWMMSWRDVTGVINLLSIDPSQVQGISKPI
jgi:hypothetical protein